MHTRSRHHYLTDHPHHAGLPRHSTISLSPPPSLSRNHSHQPFKPIHHPTDPITTHTFSHHITSHHITHMTLILHTDLPPHRTTHPLPQPTSPQHTHTHMHHLPCPQPGSRTPASSGLAHDAVQRRSLHHPHYLDRYVADCHAKTHTYAATANHQRTHSLHI